MSEEAIILCEQIEVLGNYDNESCGEGITLRRQWWSGGTWLEKGDRVVVLRPRMKGEPAPTGCGAIFKSPEGWSCDCERAHPVPCKANASPTTKEQSK